VTLRAKAIKRSIMKFGQAINIIISINFSITSIVNIIAGIALKRTKYDITLKQVPALIRDYLRNRHNRPHILYNVKK